MALLACIVVALCGLAFSPRAAHAAVGDYGTLEDGTYVISSYYASTQGYSRSWDISDNGKSDGTLVQSYSTHSGGNQRWRITTDSDGYSTIVNAQSGKALDVPGGTVDDLEQLWIWHCIDYDAQKWKITEEEHGYKITSKADERYAIDLAYSSMDNGAKVILAGDNGNPNQRWTFERCTEDAINVSDEQTELFDTSTYLTDWQWSLPVIESVTDGWSVDTNWVDGYTAHYTAGEYWNSYGAVIKARWDKIGKVNGRWVSLRYTCGDLRGDGAWSLTGDSQIAFLNNGNFQYSGLRECNVKMELFYSDSGQSVSLEGAFCGFGSLNGVEGLGVEGVGYLTSKEHKSYVLTTNNLKQRPDGSWAGDSQDDWWDSIEDCPTYNKLTASFGIVDANPKFHFYNEGSNNSSYVSVTFSPLTIATPPSPTKSAVITG